VIDGALVAKVLACWVLASLGTATCFSWYVGWCKARGQEWID
jgi:hypothetical protein